MSYLLMHTDISIACFNINAHDLKSITFLSKFIWRLSSIPSDYIPNRTSVSRPINVQIFYCTRNHSSRMRTDRAVTRMSSEWVVMRPCVNDSKPFYEQTSRFFTVSTLDWITMALLFRGFFFETFIHIYWCQWEIYVYINNDYLAFEVFPSMGGLL